MKGLCKDCIHFEPKGVLIDKNTWGLCKQFIKMEQYPGESWETGVFRWGDSLCCSNFKTDKEIASHTKKVP
jgi:hypothetical protein